MNESPLIRGLKVVLRKPIDKDVYDRLACGGNKELVKMYGGDTRNLMPYTLENAKAYMDDILSNKLNWCIEFEGRCIGAARLTVNENDRRARYAAGIFGSEGVGVQS